MSLRPYQTECLQAILNEYQNGIHRQVVTIPTGTGKTVVLAHLPQVMHLGRMLLLVHRDELIYQSVDKMTYYNPGLTVTVEKAARHADPDADIIVASVQSLRSKRLAKFNPDDTHVVVVDECHHCTSNSFKNVLRHFGVLKGEGRITDKLLVGFSATPKRSDNIGLEQIFDKIVFQRNIRDMVEENWLAEIIAYRINTMSDISDISRRGGEFVDGHLADRVNTYIRNRLIVEQYQKLGEGLPFVGFTASIQHSHDLADVFHSYGIPCEVVSGETPKAERRSIIERLNNGELIGCTSCEALSEGWDSPRVSVALMARPHTSSLPYIQKLGRVLRRFPAPEDLSNVGQGWIKPHAIILDFVDASGKIQLITTPTLFGLRAEFDAGGKSITKTKKEIEKILAANPGLDIEGINSLQEIQAIVQRVDLLGAPRIPPEAISVSKFAWLRDGQDGYRLSLPDKATTFYIRENTLGQFEVYRSHLGVRVALGTHGLRALAFQQADRLVPPDAIGAILSSARWRREEPTFKQAKLLHWKDPRIHREFPSAEAFYQFACQRYAAGNLDFSKGALSQKIDAVMETISR